MVDIAVSKQVDVLRGSAAPNIQIGFAFGSTEDCSVSWRVRHSLENRTLLSATSAPSGADHRRKRG